MASQLKNEFTQLDSTAKVQSLMQMVKLCSYGEQLQFTEQLHNFFHKDFITLLPLDITKRILSYVDIQDAFNCLLVCKTWNSIITSCSDFWEKKAHQLGLNDTFLKEKAVSLNSHVLNDICIAALSHQKYMRSLVPRSMVIAKSPSSAGYSYICAGNGIALRYQELNGHAQIIMERLATPPCSVVQLASFDVTSFSSRIKWAHASSDYVLWKQIDGKWCGCVAYEDAFLHQWNDDPVSQGFHSITFCHKCCLVAMMSEAEDDCEVWDLQVIKLRKGSSSVRKMVYPIPLEGVQSILEKKRHFGGGQVILLPDSTRKDKSGFCKSHRVLIQIDSNLAVHRLESISDSKLPLVIHRLLPDASLSKPIAILAPKSTDLPLNLVEFPGNRGCPAFCISSDHHYVALMQECYLYVWSLTSYQEESCIDLINLNLPSDSKCVAVGGMYALVASESWGIFAVIVYRTGEVLMTGTVAEDGYHPDIHHSNRFTFYQPLHEEWLSSFNYHDFWPLSMVVDYFASAERPGEQLEMKAVIGVHSRREQRVRRNCVMSNGIK